MKLGEARWPIVELEAAGVAVLDCEHKTPPAADAGVPYIAIPDIVDGRVDLARVRRITEPHFQEWTRRTRPRGGDVLVTRRGRVGDTARIPLGVDCAIGQNLVLLRSDNEHVDQSFLLWTVRGPAWTREVDRLRNVGAVFDSLNVRDIARMRVAVPPLNEQRAIASILQSLDDKIVSNRRLADTADATWLLNASALLEHATPTAASSLIAKGTLVINDGYRARNAELAEHGVPFIRAGNLTDDGIRLDGTDRVPPEVVARAGFKVATAWDSAFTSKGTVGRITLVGPEPAPFVYSPQICFWRTTDPEALSPFVLHAWMRSVYFAAQIDAVKGQTDMAEYVSLRDQRAMEIHLPTDAEQRRVARVAEPLARLAVAQREGARTLVAIRDALLPKLVSGQIRVPLSDDPAEAIGAAVEAHGATSA